MLTRSRKGFTLLELVVTLVILGVIALIAIPSFQTLINGSADKAAMTTAQSIARNANAIAASENRATVDGDVETAAGESSAAWTAVGNIVTVENGDHDQTAYVCVSGGLAVAQTTACA